MIGSRRIGSTDDR